MKYGGKELKKSRAGEGINRDNFQAFSLDASARQIVRGFFAGYEKRTRAILTGVQPPDVLEHYSELNRQIDDALREEIESARLREILRDDIATGRGYQKTLAVSYCGRRMYYELKNAVEVNFAKRIKLI